MPRKSQADLTTPRPDGRPERVSPPAGLSDTLRQAFVDLVGSVAAEHFLPVDVPLIVEYCAACALARQAAERMEDEGVVLAGKPNPWLVVREKAIREMGLLAMRLRVSPQGRLSAAKAGSMKMSKSRPWED